MKGKSSVRHRRERPFVFLNVAITADGKLAPANRRFAGFTSERDQELLHELRAGADAVMAGARTVDSASVTMGAGGEKYRKLRRRNGLAEENLRAVVSGSGSINPKAAIFRQRFSPIIILVTQRARPVRIRRLQQLGAIVHVCGAREIDFPRALRWLRQRWNVRRLLCEGGGEINDALFRAGLVDEVHLTLSPKIFGGCHAPTLCDGEGIRPLGNAVRLNLESRRRVGDEMFLKYGVLR